MKPADVFVGREREMAELTAALDDAIAGHGGLVMLVGEPGIGKTRIAEELATAALQKDADVLWGRCREERGAPPLWPWVQVMRALLDRSNTDSFAAELRPSAERVAAILPSIRDGSTLAAPPKPAQDLSAARYQLFDAVASFIRLAARSRPLLIILDNLHWADSASLRLLQYLAPDVRDSPLLVLGTCRPGELRERQQLGHVRGELARERSFLEIALRGLSLDDVAELVESAHVSRPKEPLARRIYQFSEGNPFFVREVLRFLDSGPTEAARRDRLDDQSNLPLPETVQDVARQRLCQLSKRSTDLLSIAAVIGREFSVALLGAVTRRSEDDLRDGLGQAAHAYIVRELVARVGQFQFTHALLRQTLLAGLPISERVRLHAQVAKSLERVHRQDLESHAAELAYHFGAAGTHADRGSVAKYSLLAGRQALAAHAYDEAKSHFERGSAAIGRRPPSLLAADLLRGLGQAQTAVLPGQQMSEAVRNLVQSFDYYLKLHRADRAIEVAKISTPPFPSPNLGDVQLVARGLELVDPASRDGTVLLARYGKLLAVSAGDAERGREILNRAIVAARAIHEGDLLARTLADAATIEFWALDFPRCIMASDEALAVNDGHDRLISWQAHFYASLAHADQGTPESALDHARSCLEDADKLRERFRRIRALTAVAGIEIATGDWDAGRASIDAGLDLDPLDHGLLAWRIRFELQMGNFDQAEEWFKRLSIATDRAGPGPTNERREMVAAAGEITYVTGDTHHLGTVRNAAREILADRLATPLARRDAEIALAFATAVDQREGRSTRLPAETGWKWLVNSFPQGISTMRLCGIAQRSAGQVEEAIASFESASEASRRAGYLPEVAWASYETASTLMSRSDQAARRKAWGLVKEGDAIARELRMQPLVARFDALKRQMAGRGRIPSPHPDSLTDREVAVLRLIAAGQSNREIAGRLVISVHTVLRHVSNIFAKTGVANRAEAASYATRHGLVS